MNMLRISAVFLLCGVVFFSRLTVSAETSGDQRSQELQSKIDEYTKKISELQDQKNTLSTQIRYMDTQIVLAVLQIQKTEEIIIKTKTEISDISEKIDGLNESIDYLSMIIAQKITEGYKSRSISFFDFFFNSSDFSSLVNRIKYLKVAQDNDRRVVFQAQQAKVNYEDQKNIREQKQKQLEELTVKLNQQKIALNLQKNSKQQILEDTNNDEKIYQDLLSKAKVEFTAIQGIIAGKGTETYIRDVLKGETIATVISGASCNSNGTHLHFMVKEGESVIDPFSKLKQVDYLNDSNGDLFNPSGAWDWPLSPTIKLNQGYGNTWFVRTYRWYSFHNGIDISGSSVNVRAVADGKLYRGSYSGFKGCTLPYVMVTHSNSNIASFYLHVY